MARKNDKEQYAKYLCSREWNVLKEAVHKRARGLCERCEVFPIDAVHHLTYERKYHETLEDLQGICNHCHEFTHGKSDFDPAANFSMRLYFSVCRTKRLIPAPVQVAADLYPIKRYWTVLRHAIVMLRGLEEIAGFPLDLSNAGELLNSALPFDLMYLDIWRSRQWDFSAYDRLRNLLGYPQIADIDIVEEPSIVEDEE